MELYTMKLEGDTLFVDFGKAADNNEIVTEVNVSIASVAKKCHGKVIKINGRASLPVAMTIAHGLAHVARAIACYDPKLQKYVVAISHAPDLNVGDLLD